MNRIIRLSNKVTNTLNISKSKELLMSINDDAIHLCVDYIVKTWGCQKDSLSNTLFNFNLGLVFSGYDKFIADGYFKQALSELKDNSDSPLRHKIEFAIMVNNLERISEIPEGKYERALFCYLDAKNILDDILQLEDKEYCELYSYNPSETINYLIVNIAKSLSNEEYIEIILFKFLKMLTQLLTPEVYSELNKLLFRKYKESLLIQIIYNRVLYTTKQIEKNYNAENMICDIELHNYENLAYMAKELKFKTHAIFEGIIGLGLYNRKEYIASIEPLEYASMEMMSISPIYGYVVSSAIEVYSMTKQEGKAFRLFSKIHGDISLDGYSKTTIYLAQIGCMVENYNPKHLTTLENIVYICRNMITKSKDYRLGYKYGELLEKEMKLYLMTDNTEELARVVNEAFRFADSRRAYLETAIEYMRTAFEHIKNSKKYKTSFFDDLDGKFTIKGIKTIQEVLALNNSNYVYELQFVNENKMIQMFELSGFLPGNSGPNRGTLILHPIIGRLDNFYYMMFKIIEEENNKYHLEFDKSKDGLFVYLNFMRFNKKR